MAQREVSDRLISNRSCLSAVDAVCVATPGSFGPEIRHLLEKGLRLDGALKLCRAAEYWDPGRAPDFLKDRSGGTEMYERLSDLSHSLYLKLGHSSYLLESAVPLLQKEYEIAPPSDLQGLPDFMARFSAMTMEDALASEALVASFVVTLVGATDVLAAVGALVLNLNYGIWEAHFSKFEKALRHAQASRSVDPRCIRAREVSDAVLPLLDRTGNQADWMKQLVHYRHAYTHRAIICKAGEPIEGERGLRQRWYLPRDPIRLPSEVVPNPERRTNLREDEVAARFAAFLPEPPEDYLRWAYEQVEKLCDKALDALANVFEERNENPSLFANDPEVLLRRPKNQTPTGFRGTSV